MQPTFLLLSYNDDVPMEESGMTHNRGSTNIDGAYTIGQLSELFGLSPRIIRSYAEQGLLQPRRLGRMPIYSESDKIRLEVVLKANRFGFSLAEICLLLKTVGKAADDKSKHAVGRGQREIELQLEMLTIRQTLLAGAIADLRTAHRQQGVRSVL